MNAAPLGIIARLVCAIPTHFNNSIIGIDSKLFRSKKRGLHSSPDFSRSSAPQPVPQKDYKQFLLKYLGERSGGSAPWCALSSQYSYPFRSKSQLFAFPLLPTRNNFDILSSTQKLAPRGLP